MSTAESTQEKTGLGNYFVANYPPFSLWKREHLDAAHAALQTSGPSATPLGLYLHIPFCRKRCKFCYFRVYTDKNARDVERYVSALVREVELYSRLPSVRGRTLHFVYFGGGTPSYLSAGQLTAMVGDLNALVDWHHAAEVTFECEPGTLQQHKLAALKELGVTRLSLGIENFDDTILEANGRAHLSAEIHRAYSWARDLNFNQINIDLIAGMVGETWEKWRTTVEKTIQLSPDSVTIYQMELPYNTVFSHELTLADQTRPAPLSVADWPTKRAWVRHAFDRFQEAGYRVSSAYTLVKDTERTQFVYRDSLWHGADMLGTGVASFGHMAGVHIQNLDTWEPYLEMLDKGELPLARAFALNKEQLLIREMILQLKTGRLEPGYFRQKFGKDILHHFAGPFAQLQNDGFLKIRPEQITTTEPGLLQIDRLLPAFFLTEDRVSRYT
jgi:oxygen-independent coproporphyrinogen-3 oxidase